MKKMIPLLLCLSMLLTVCAVTVPTAALNDSVNDSTWSEIELKALVYQEGKSFYSALTKGYENYDSGWKEIRELDDEEREICSINMRGFCVTPDGKYALMGHLNGSNFRGCALYDFASGAITDVYYRFDSEQDPSVAQGPFSYVKGIAADDRGNVRELQLIFFGRESNGEGWLEIEARGGSGVRYRACDAAEAPAAARRALDR
mgnify:CR=1 FL=1